jgi:predicted regulator of Ras-like GTPase activity (Roadblock/LC7/MglB family)
MTEPAVSIPALLRDLAQREARTLADDLGGIRGVVVATADGFDVASVVHPPLDAARIAALASSMAAIGEVVATEAAIGRSTSVTVGSDEGFAVVHAIQRADVSLVINVVAGPSALLGQVLYGVADAARRLAQA